MKRMLSGGRPTGRLHLGHYIGALRPYVEMAADYDCVWVIADLHMLTTKSDPRSIGDIRVNARSMIVDCIGAGFNPDKVTFYLQSNVPQMPQIFVFLQNLISLSQVQRISSLQEMARHVSMAELNLGLLDYPVLEAADVISIQADVVPVGRDNIDHIQIARYLAMTLNKTYGTPFVIPECRTSEHNYLVGIDGREKMSKSLDNAIYLRDTPEQIVDKIQGMPWYGSRHDDVARKIEKEPVMLYLEVLGKDEDQVQHLTELYRHNALTEQRAKSALVDVCCSLLKPVRDCAVDALSDTSYIDQLLRRGTERATDMASNTLATLRACMGMPDVL